MSLGSNGVDRVRSLRKIPKWLRDTNFCTSWTHFRLSVVTKPNGPKCTQIVWNAQKHEFTVQWGRIYCVCCKNFRWDFMARSFSPVWPVLHWAVGQKKVPNVLKKYETHQNMSLGSNGVDRVHSLRKIPKRLHGTNFCTTSARFALSFIRQPKGPKCTRIVWNTPKREFRVQWGGSGAFVMKNYNVTSLYEVLY